MTERHYIKPKWNWTGRLFNGVVVGLTRLGLSVYGSRELAVRGRRSGEWRTVPVNLLEHDGVHYLVAPRGETQWVRNLRASGSGELRIGRQRQQFRATELPDEEKPPLLRAYLRKWGFEVKAFFGDVGAAAPESELRRIAPAHPVFRIEQTYP